jgi:hypothetical protein
VLRKSGLPPLMVLTRKTQVVPRRGLEPPTYRFRFVTVSRLPGLSLHHVSCEVTGVRQFIGVLWAILILCVFMIGSGTVLRAILGNLHSESPRTWCRGPFSLPNAAIRTWFTLNHMNYHGPPLILTDTSVSDAKGTIGLDDLPDPQPFCTVRLKNTTPLMERLWRIALSDIEANQVETDDGVYFGAGKSFGATVYTRDISYSGVLGLNYLYPEVMLNSLRYSRKVRLELMFRVSKGYVLKNIGNWCQTNYRSALIHPDHSGICGWFG